MDLYQNELPNTLIVDLSKRYGGSTSRVLSLLERMPRNKVALAALASSAVADQAQRLGLPVHLLGSHKIDPRILPSIIHLIRRESIQVLDSQNIQSKFWASLAAGPTKTALVSTIHSWYANSEQGKTSTKGKIYTALEFATNRHLKHYITVSQMDYRSLIRAGIPEENIDLVYNAVDIRPDTISGNPGWLRQKFDLPHDAIVCLAIGRLVPVKGFDLLIEAVQKVREKLPHFVCLIVGDGALKQELTDQIQRTGLQTSVYLVGFFQHNEVLKMLKSSDIFVMSSRYEGTPIALLEAAALGIPIIASGTGGIPELVQNGKHALLVPPNESGPLAQGLMRLSQELKFAHQLGENAQQRVRQHFNLDGQVQATMEVYIKAWKKLRVTM